MKFAFKFLRLALLAVTLVPPMVSAQGTAFTYQGRYTSNGVPVNATVEVQFTLWDALTGGSQIASATPPTSIVTVTNGLFTVPIDFGAAAFDGSERYLQIETRTTIGAFTLLTSRQRITPTPYAILAGKLSGPLVGTGLAGTYGSAVNFSNQANNFTGNFAGNGGGLSNLNVTSLGGVSISNLWRTGGNAGTTAGAHFLGTTDNQPLELKVNGQRAFRLEPIVTRTNAFAGGSIMWSNAPNVLGGSSVNRLGPDAAGAVIAGGGGEYYVDTGAGYQYFGPLSNYTSGALSTLGGGGQNRILSNSIFSTIGGGQLNVVQASAFNATISGGGNNTIEASVSSATIGGGSANTIKTNARLGTISGGGNNVISAQLATIGGGDENLVAAGASWSTIAGGQRNVSSNSYASVGGGTLNIAGGFASTVAGGHNNRSSVDYATVSGGDANVSSFFATTVGGGQSNVSSGSYATVPGGFANRASGLYSFAAGNRARANNHGSFVWSDAQSADFASGGDNQFCIRANGGLRLNGDTPVYFGSSLGQRLNLFSTTFAIGIQGGVQYSRVATGGGFGWYAGGAPNDNTFNAGGGVTLMTLTAGGLVVNGTFVSASDRNGKENITPIEPASILEKVLALPLTTWNYKIDATTRHLGPMAQDFHAAFGVGPDDKHIATVDADGVALAAIQGLHQKLTRELEQRDAENALLKERLDRLEARLDQALESAK